jgi:ribosome biogenesis GTPase
MSDLEALGWRAELAAALAECGEDLAAMRVVLAERGAYRVADGEEEVMAGVSGRLRHRAVPGALPVVGDWVGVRAGVIEAVLPRRTVLARRDADRAREQVLVANVDIAILVMGLDGDYNLRRLERYLAMVGAAGVRAAAVLSKADLHPAAGRLAEVASRVPAVAADLTAPGGPLAVLPLFAPRETAVLLGSSGAGKSTLLNGLLGEEVQRTAPVRAHDSRGRHTTSRRQLFRLAGGALVIDTPGLRAIEGRAIEQVRAEGGRGRAAGPRRRRTRPTR